MNHVILTVDLGFGDAGKGSIVDYLARTEGAHTVVRYNGGPQAAHRVVTAEAIPREHVFSQFGSGTLAGATTHLSRFMLIEPLAMLAEADHLRELGITAPFDRTTIDEHALVITPFQRAINRLRELARGDKRHGSCGMGIGETMADAQAFKARMLRAGDLANPRRLRERLAFLHELNIAKLAELRPILPDTPQVTQELELLDSNLGWLLDAYHNFARTARIVPHDYLHHILHTPGTVIFEGAQGVLLDEWHGFHPYTTWSTTTLENADRLLQEAGFDGRITRLGLTRAYSTRHGAGPFPSEDAPLTSALPDACNGEGPWQGGFRAGWLDLVLLRYAVEVVGQLDELAVTCLDRVAALPEVHVCSCYQEASARIERLAPSPRPHDLNYQERLTQRLQNCQPVLARMEGIEALVAAITDAVGVPVTIRSYGPTAADKQRTPQAHLSKNIAEPRTSCAALPS